jgi:hypothetical protein
MAGKATSDERWAAETNPALAPERVLDAPFATVPTST